MTEKLFIIRKYIKARSAEEAIKLDKRSPVEDCFLDEEYRLRLLDNELIGFKNERKNNRKEIE